MDKEIIWNLVNAGLTSGLVFLGAWSTGEITTQTFIIAGIAGLTAGIVQFKSYWSKEETEYKSKLFKFL